MTRRSAVDWLTWVDEVSGELRHDRYLQQWKCPELSEGGTFRWRADVDPDALEYLVHGLLRLDEQLATDVEQGGQTVPPDEGREFYLVLVRDLLHALEMEGTGRAAFVEQLRDGWPSAAEAI